MSGIGSVESAQHSELRPASDRLPSTSKSLIRLIPLEYCNVGRINLGQSIEPLIPEIGRVSDRELDLSRALNVPVRVAERQVEHAVIESRAEVVDGIPESETRAFEQIANMGDVCHIEDVIAALWLVLGSHPWEVVQYIECRPQIVINRVAMFFGPSNYRCRRSLDNRW